MELIKDTFYLLTIYDWHNKKKQSFNNGYSMQQIGNWYEKMWNTFKEANGDFFPA